MNDRQRIFLETIGELQTTLQYLHRTGWAGYDCSTHSLDVLQRWGTGEVRFRRLRLEPL